MAQAQCTTEVCRLDINYLNKVGLFKYESSKASTQLNWNNGNSIQIYCIHSVDEIFIELQYTITSYIQEKRELSYRINIEQVPSNLGKGKVLYFRCPDSNRRCRILYLAYGSHIFKARQAYQNRIYYEAQKESKQYYAITKYNVLKRKIDKIKELQKRQQQVYNGRFTKNAQRILQLEIKQLKYQDQSTATMYRALGIDWELEKQMILEHTRAKKES